jgi:hypothetical protein
MDNFSCTRVGSGLYTNYTLKLGFLRLMQRFRDPFMLLINYKYYSRITIYSTIKRDNDWLYFSIKWLIY